MHLAGKVAVVTGPGRGLGRAHAEALAASGARRSRSGWCDGVRMLLDFTAEIDGAAKPACVARAVHRHYL